MTVLKRAASFVRVAVFITVPCVAAYFLKDRVTDWWGTAAMRTGTFSGRMCSVYACMQLPADWRCVLEVTEFVCRSGSDENRARQAIVIMTAKEVGPTDAFDQYIDHLRNPITTEGKSGAKLTSEVVYVRKIEMNGLAWVDGLHLGSEVRNYYTRYLATLNDRVAVLITFSAHKDYYKEYREASEKLARTIEFNAR